MVVGSALMRTSAVEEQVGVNTGGDIYLLQHITALGGGFRTVYHSFSFTYSVTI